MSADLTSTIMTPEQIVEAIDWPFTVFRMPGHKARVVSYARLLKEYGMTDHFVADFLREIYMDAFTEADLQRNAK